MKEKVLGKKYELSLVIATEAELKRLNTTYRDKQETTDILSFPLSDTSGEIYLCPQDATRQAPNFDMEPIEFMGFLFIHGLLHLKGYDHGSTMEHEEAKLVKFFALSETWPKKSPSALTSERIKSKRS